MKRELLKNKKTLSLVIAATLFLLIFFGFIPIPEKCRYLNSMHDAVACYPFFFKEFWLMENNENSWYQMMYFNLGQELIIEPIGYTVEKVFLHPQYPADFSDDRALVGAAHNIFVGKVMEQTGTKERGIGPETQFEVQVIDNIKGELEGTTTVNQLGGYKDDTLYLVEGDTFTKDSDQESLLQVGSTYLFMTRINQKEQWNTIISFPGANKLLSSSELSFAELKTAVINKNSRVKHLRYVYPQELLLEADVLSGNALNSFILLQEAMTTDEESVVEESETATTEQSVDDLGYPLQEASSSAEVESTNTEGGTTQTENLVESISSSDTE